MTDGAMIIVLAVIAAVAYMVTLWLFPIDDDEKK